ncbi:MAG: hypothetical protein JXB03_08745 [Spirochaetales bacterium]|nr:hypothetical protein [Spirochaetales bacterium]
MARFSSLREKLQQDNITQTEITARESRLWRSIEHKMLSRKKHPLLHRSINLPLPALAALCLVMAASMVTAAYHGFAAHTYNFPPDELPSFSTMDELIGYLEQTQRTGIMEMSLPEDPVFLFISQPTLMPEREYRDAKW